MGSGVGPIAKDFVAETGSECDDARLHPVGDVYTMIGDADLKPDRGSDWSSLFPDTPWAQMTRRPTIQ